MELREEIGVQRSLREREIGEERATVGRTQETRESKAEMGGLC